MHSAFRGSLPLALTVAALAGPCLAATAPAASGPINPLTTAAGQQTKVTIQLSCLPNPATMKLSDCKVISVNPASFASLVSVGAVTHADASPLPPDWQSLPKDGARVLVPVMVTAERNPQLGGGGAQPTTSPPPAGGGDVVVTVSCLPNPDLSVRDCQVDKVDPPAAGAGAAALNAVSQAKLAANWRTLYKQENGRVVLPVRLSKAK